MFKSPNSSMSSVRMKKKLVPRSKTLDYSNMYLRIVSAVVCDLIDLMNIATYRMSRSSMAICRIYSKCSSPNLQYIFIRLIKLSL